MQGQSEQGVENEGALISNHLIVEDVPGTRQEELPGDRGRDLPLSVVEVLRLSNQPTEQGCSGHETERRPA
jgi:hypothetical protein